MSGPASGAPVLPGAELGLLGGGQLGRMFVQAAATMGYRVAVLEPDASAPAVQIAHRHVHAAYDDLEAVEGLAASVAAVTGEFENVPALSLERAARHVPVRPGARVFGVAQDRIVEKATLNHLGLPVAPHAAIESAADLGAARLAIPEAGILKTATAGYDGHGQVSVAGPDELAGAWEQLGGARTVLERRLRFEREFSVLGVRGADGRTLTYEPVGNDHSSHVLDISICPAGLAPEVDRRARQVTTEILEGLDVVGVLCVEFFLLDGDEIVVNEIAPRPHNSGHLTIEAHTCSQFEQQVRAVCGLPLGSTRRKVGAAAMANLLGDVWQSGTPNWTSALESPGVSLHLYGKTEARPGRKMGHLTVVGDDAAMVEALARSTRAALAVPDAPGEATGAPPRAAQRPR